MSNFKVIITFTAVDDITEVFNYIAYEVGHPQTAERYREGIMQSIDKLACYADIFAISQQPFLRRLYGTEVRTIHYKKMTIVYTIVGNTVYVHRVMASSLIR